MTRRLAQPYKRHPVTEQYDAIVIGSGIGGLACAAMLAKHGGRKVLVLERHYTPGGYTHVFHRPGYEWDVGVHYVGGVEPGSAIRRMFDDISDGAIEWADMGEVYDRVIIDGDTYDLPKGRRNLRAMLVDRFPGEEAAIDAYFEAVRSAVSASMPFQAAKTLPGPVAAVAGPLLRRNFRRWSDRTTREVLAELTDDQRLIAVLTAQFGDYGLAPADSSFAMHALVASHYFRGGYYPVGGSSVIAESIIPVIERAGGTVLVSAEVAEVVVEDGRAVGVRMAADDAVLRAPIVISDAGVSATFDRLVPREVAERAGLPEHLAKVAPSMAHLCLYLGFERPAEELGLPKHNLWIYPSDDYEGTIEASRRDPGAALPMLYVSFPAAKDPDFARRHPGRATIDVITAAPYEWFEPWAGSRWKRRAAEYDAFKASLAERMLEGLYAQLPQLRGQVAVQELSTPLTTAHFAGYARGELYGLEHSPERFAQGFLKPATPIPGLYLTGQDIVSCGVAGALFGGVLTATTLLRGPLMLGLGTAALQRVVRSPVRSPLGRDRGSAANA
ncbi:MAG: NAD(P)/FAD-dependent oxidoreductase [Candidatus Nanopelagicales bacterium]|nr:NAD(P)/FAD-dependent oxidoreductase [Candidatus Nanopelagicales bacterium]